MPILHLIFGDRFQKVNTQKSKYQCMTHFCVQHNIVLWIFFLCSEVRKSDHRATLKNEHLEEWISSALTTYSTVQIVEG